MHIMLSLPKRQNPAWDGLTQAFLSLLVDNPSISTADLATNIVETYIDQDERITDENARMDFLRQNSSSGGFFGPYRQFRVPQQIITQLEKNITLTAVDLNALPDLITAFKSFLVCYAGYRPITGCQCT